MLLLLITTFRVRQNHGDKTVMVIVKIIVTTVSYQRCSGLWWLQCRNDMNVICVLLWHHRIKTSNYLPILSSSFHQLLLIIVVAIHYRLEFIVSTLLSHEWRDSEQCDPIKVSFWSLFWIYSGPCSDWRQSDAGHDSNRGK